MKIILVIMFGVFALDAALYAYFVHAGAGALFAGALMSASTAAGSVTPCVMRRAAMPATWGVAIEVPW